MQQFYYRIESGNDFLTFYFNSIYTVEGDRYHVSVVGKDKKVYSFLMMRVDNGWALVHPENCPPWITHLEEKISNIIIESLA